MIDNTPHRLLFLDGIGCNPDGFKPRFLRGLGYQVEAPLLPDLDFLQSVSIAERVLRETKPDVVIGYSRGGAVALAIDDQMVPRLLIAPALHWVQHPVTLRGPVIMLHSEGDDSLALDHMRGEMSRLGLLPSILRIVGDDHTMIDDAALAAIQTALQELIAH